MTPQPTIQQSAINVVETPNETTVMYSITSESRHSPENNNCTSCTTVAKRRPEDTSQWLVQSRSHMNPFEENFQESNLLPRRTNTPSTGRVKKPNRYRKGTYNA
ncbi:Hypothetical predicted protein [Mytilus galloprovincialis]|uniref:Uncharacterized protein n=1 Tax=Mytilus galloprovincialis TaxID=29158 RepID=A0A8B6DZM8_MYTGA|nr:Hypothetical predicted protein [Mytilus galloprovincialis]